MKETLLLNEAERKSPFSHMAEIAKMFLLRLRKDASFYVMLGISTFASLILALVICLVFRNTDEESPSILLVWCQIVGSADTGFALLLFMGLLFSTIFIAKEFSYGTMRNIILAGKKRSEIYVVSLIFSIAMTLLFFLIPIIILCLMSLCFQIPIFPSYFGAEEIGRFFAGVAMLLLYGLSSVAFVVSLMFMMGRGNPAWWIFYGVLIFLYIGYLVGSAIITASMPSDEGAKEAFISNWTLVFEFIPTYQKNYFRTMADFRSLSSLTSLIFGVRTDLSEFPRIIAISVIEYIVWGVGWTTLGLVSFNKKNLK